jgi:stalled ribosome rescue protein Dom34
MSNKKQFGVWMDKQHATVVGKSDIDSGVWTVLAHVKGHVSHGNSNEHTAQNHEQTLTTNFFKEIATHMPNVDVLHLTGTGQVQGQFAHYLTATAQYKNTQTTESTSNKMSDEALLEYFSARMH